MRVLFVTASAAAGGGPRHLLDWLEALRSRIGQEFEPFVAAPAEGLFAGPLREMAIESFDLPEKSFSISKLHRLRQFVRQHKIDLVHSFGRAGGLYGRLLAQKGVPVFHTPQGLISSSLSQGPYDLLERWLNGKTRKYVFGSISEADEGRERFGAKNGLILPPVIFPPSETMSVEAVTAIETKRPIIIGSIGRFVAHKRMIELARAVQAMGPEFELRLYGDGEQKAALESIAAESKGRIQVRGLVDRWQALSEVDVFASWSISESFGLAVAEAMTFGIPCVLSDVPGHRDLAARQTRAWLFDPSKGEDFARVVRRILADQTSRLERVTRAKNEIRELCGHERVANELLCSYQKACR